MRGTIRSISLLLAVIISVLLMAGERASGAAVEDQAEFYKGKTINLTVSSGPGGPPDIFARAIGPILQKELNATVLVQNMTTGSAMEAVNHTYSKAKPDGLTLCTGVSEAWILNDILEDPGSRFKVDKLNWLGIFNPETFVYVSSAQKPYQSAKDLQQAKGLKMGGVSGAGAITVKTALACAMLGLDAKVVTGFKGSADIALSLQKGELDGSTALESFARDAERKGQVKALFYLYKKGSSYPNMPSLSEIVKVSDDYAKILNVIGMESKCIVTSPGVPKERVDFLKKLLQKIADDKENQKKFAQALMLDKWLGYMPGDQYQKFIADLKGNQNLISQLKAVMEKYKY
jgi:tripartite-type tricarboxylate transporter receptor subunit TctC